MARAMASSRLLVILQRGDRVLLLIYRGWKFPLMSFWMDTYMRNASWLTEIIVTPETDGADLLTCLQVS